MPAREGVEGTPIFLARLCSFFWYNSFAYNQGSSNQKLTTWTTHCPLLFSNAITKNMHEKSQNFGVDL